MNWFDMAVNIAEQLGITDERAILAMSAFGMVMASVAIADPAYTKGVMLEAIAELGNPDPEAHYDALIAVTRLDLDLADERAAQTVAAAQASASLAVTE